MSATISVIDDPAAAAALMDPMKRAVLAEMHAPTSATGVAKALGLPRQRVTYHVRELEKAGLVKHVEDVRRRNCVERRLVATADRFLVSPEALGSLRLSLADVSDRFSAGFLMAVAAETIRDVAALEQGAAVAGKRLATLSAISEVTFASPAEQNAFAEELATAVTALVHKYQSADRDGGRTFRVTLGAYPKPRRTGQQTPSPQGEPS